MKRILCASVFVLAAILGAIGCNGDVNGVPIVISGGALTEQGSKAVLRLSESKPNPACGTEEPSDVEVVITLDALRTGKFTIGKDASAVAKTTDKICKVAFVLNSPATHGEVDVTELDAASATGTYDLDFDAGEVNGGFDVKACELAASKSLSAPDCDDVDHNGEPGDQRESSGGGCGGGD
jgi:hypothetical protein